jgi:hypothetical protein
MKRVTVCLSVLLTAGTGQAALIQHLDASLPGSVVTDADGLVSEWIDQSGSGNNAVIAREPVIYPSTSVSASGLSGLDFGTARYNLRLFESEDTDSWLNFDAGSGGTATGGFAVLIAFKADTVRSEWNDLIGNSTTLDSGFLMRYGSSGVMHVSLEGTIQKNAQLNVEDGDTIVYAFNYDATTGAYDFWDSKNNSSMTGTKAAADFSTPRHFTLGTMDTPARYINGMVGEVKIYDDVLSAEDFQAEREALVQKWIVSGSPIKAHAPQPGIGAARVPLDQELSWTTGLDPNDPDIPNPAITGHNLWLSIAYDPMNPPVERDWQEPIEVPADTNPADGNVDPMASYSPAGLQRDALYYWIVDESLGAADPRDWDNIIVGALWSFETITSAPEVDAGSNIVTWLKEGTTTVKLNAIVTDVTGDVTATTWSAVAAPPDTTVDIADTSAVVTTATLTATGVYALELHAVDAKLNEGSDQMEIEVYADSCEAAQNHPDGYVAPTGDFNNDCKVDFADFAVFADAWLGDASLMEDGLYDPD